LIVTCADQKELESGLRATSTVLYYYQAQDAELLSTLIEGTKALGPHCHSHAPATLKCWTTKARRTLRPGRDSNKSCLPGLLEGCSEAEEVLLDQHTLTIQIVRGTSDSILELTETKALLRLLVLLVV
jgi:hypothetical protein